MGKSKQKKTRTKAPHPYKRIMQDGDKDWNHPCNSCGELPTVYPTGLCGPCCFGEADTAGGNW